MIVIYQAALTVRRPRLIVPTNFDSAIALGIVMGELISLMGSSAGVLCSFCTE